MLKLDRKPSALRVLAIASVLTAGATGVRTALGILASDVVPFVPLFLSTFLAVLLWGGLAGVAAFGASTLLAWYFFHPPVLSLALSGSSAVNPLLFAAMQAAVVLVGATFRKALERASSAEAVLPAVSEQMPAAAFVLEAPSDDMSLATPQAAELLGAQRRETRPGNGASILQCARCLTAKLSNMKEGG